MYVMTGKWKKMPMDFKSYTYWKMWSKQRWQDACRPRRSWRAQTGKEPELLRWLCCSSNKVKRSRNWIKTKWKESDIVSRQSDIVPVSPSTCGTVHKRPTTTRREQNLSLMSAISNRNMHKRPVISKREAATCMLSKVFSR